MKIAKVILLVLVLLAPVGATSVVFFSDDDQQCELLENLEEEEEGDDNETESFEEREIIGHDQYYKRDRIIVSDVSIQTYLDHNQYILPIVMEVNTPPPENTLI